MERKSLYDPQVYAECIKRINTIKFGTLPLWGKMDAAQMLAHCAEIFETFNGKELKGTNWLVKLFAPIIKNMVINEKPYKRNSQTHPQYKQTNPKFFEEEKKHLLEELRNFHEMDKEKAKNIEHTMFGKLTLEERGWSMYKHLDHHLQQFGA